MRLSILTSLLFLFSLAVFAEDDLTIYRAKYRPAEELVKVAGSLFAGRANISSLNEKIVIAADSKTTKKVLELFAELDRKPRQYRISFRLVSKGTGSRSAVGVKDARVGIGKKPTVTATVAVDAEDAESAGDSLQSTQLTEGREAAVFMGSDWFPGGFLAKVRGGTGKLATVEFRQREGNRNPAFGLASEVSLGLGQWKTVGGINQKNQGSGSGILHREGQSGAQEKDLQIKLDAVK